MRSWALWPLRSLSTRLRRSAASSSLPSSRWRSAARTLSSQPVLLACAPACFDRALRRAASSARSVAIDESDSVSDVSAWSSRRSSAPFSRVDRASCATSPSFVWRDAWSWSLASIRILLAFSFCERRR